MCITHNVNIPWFRGIFLGQNFKAFENKSKLPTCLSSPGWWASVDSQVPEEWQQLHQNAATRFLGNWLFDPIQWKSNADQLYMCHLLSTKRFIYLLTHKNPNLVAQIRAGNKSVTNNHRTKDISRIQHATSRYLCFFFFLKKNQSTLAESGQNQIREFLTSICSFRYL